MALGLLAAISIAGCDAGQQGDQLIVVGPAIALVPFDPDGGSLTTVSSTQAFPADQPIVLQFNRLLNPNSVTRQSIVLQSSSQTSLADPVVAYDPVLMTVTLSNPMDGMPWLVAGLSYQIAFPVPANKNDINGLQAIDDATFATPTTIAFTAGPGLGSTSAAPTMNFCVDILPIFTANCTGSICHSSQTSGSLPTPAAGLILDNSEGVALTAIGQVAIGSNTGASAGVSESPGVVFGVDMPVIDPGTNGTGDPANSWLLYKVLLAAPSPPTDAGAIFQCNPAQTQNGFDQSSVSPAAMSDERALLSNFILGNQMPYPTVPSSPQEGLTVQELERLRLWIAQGAPLETVVGPDGGMSTNCNMCTQILGTETDASAGESSDGGTDGSIDAPAMDAGTNG